MTLFRPIFPVFLALTLGVAWLFPAFASDNALLARMLADQNEQRHLLRAAARSTVPLQNPRAAAKLSLIGAGAVYKPLAAEDSGKIISGLWKQAVDEQHAAVNRRRQRSLIHTPRRNEPIGWFQDHGLVAFAEKVWNAGRFGGANAVNAIGRFVS